MQPNLLPCYTQKHVNYQIMTKSHLLAVMALTLILTGCGNTSNSDDPNVFTHEYELCSENGEMVEYIVERPGEQMPEGVGPAIQLHIVNDWIS